MFKRFQPNIYPMFGQLQPNRNYLLVHQWLDIYQKFVIVSRTITNGSVADGRTKNICSIILNQTQPEFATTQLNRKLIDQTFISWRKDNKTNFFIISIVCHCIRSNGNMVLQVFYFLFFMFFNFLLQI